MTVKEFEADTMTVYAVTRRLEIISGATRGLGADVKLRHPSLRWSEIAGAGNIYRHDCERVSADVPWGTVRNALPLLLLAVEAELDVSR